MHVSADICVVPIGAGASVSEYVAACEAIFDEAGLEHRLHAHGTNVEGPWEEVLAAVRRCHERLHEMGAPRLQTSLKLSTRTDRAQSLEEKIESVQKKRGP